MKIIIIIIIIIKKVDNNGCQCATYQIVVLALVC